MKWGEYKVIQKLQPSLLNVTCGNGGERECAQFFKFIVISCLLGCVRLFCGRREEPSWRCFIRSRRIMRPGKNDNMGSTGSEMGGKSEHHSWLVAIKAIVVHQTQVIASGKVVLIFFSARVWVRACVWESASKRQKERERVCVCAPSYLQISSPPPHVLPGKKKKTLSGFLSALGRRIRMLQRKWRRSRRALMGKRYFWCDAWGSGVKSLRGAEGEILRIDGWTHLHATWTVRRRKTPHLPITAKVPRWRQLEANVDCPSLNKLRSTFCLTAVEPVMFDGRYLFLIVGWKCNPANPLYFFFSFDILVMIDWYRQN